MSYYSKLWNILHHASSILDIDRLKVFIKYVLVSMKCKDCYLHGMNFINNTNISNPEELICTYHKDVDEDKFINNIKPTNLYIKDCFELILTGIIFEYDDYIDLLSIIDNICLDKIEDILDNDYHILNKTEIYINIFKQYRTDVTDNATLIKHFFECKSNLDLCHL